jgi:hypothetical protein
MTPTKATRVTPIVVGLVVVLVAAVAVVGFSRPRTAPPTSVIKTRFTAHRPAPLRVGQAVVGTPDHPILWTASQGSGTVTEPAPGGVDFTIADAGEANWAPLPGSAVLQHTRVDGDVQFLSGAPGNALGLGCEDQAEFLQFWFFIHDNGTWTFDRTPAGTGSSVILLDRGFSPALQPTMGPNHLAVACRVVTPQETEFQLAVDGTPVADLDVGVVSLGWMPIIAQCSPNGPDTGSFTDLVESTW